MLLLYKNESHTPLRSSRKELLLNTTRSLHSTAVAFLKKYISQYKKLHGLLKFIYTFALLDLSAQEVLFSPQLPRAPRCAESGLSCPPCQPSRSPAERRIEAEADTDVESRQLT